MGLEHPPSSKTPPPLSCQASPLKSANYSSTLPFLGNPPSILLVFVTSHSLLKIGFSSTTRKIKAVSSPPPHFFEHLVGDSTPPRKRGGAHYDCN